MTQVETTKEDTETTKEDLDRLDMDWASPFLDQATRPYFHLPAGVEHYRLLAHLSHQMSRRLVIDVGTFHGASALALSACPKTRVVSFDLVDHRTIPIERENLQFHLADVLQAPDLIREASLILLDTFHDGPFEQRFYEALEALGYRGLLLLDDIYLNPPMQGFWRGIPRPKRDWTHLGHWSGTGIVSFTDRPTKG